MLQLRTSARIAAAAITGCAALVVPAASLAQAGNPSRNGGPTTPHALVLSVASRETAAPSDLSPHAGALAHTVAAEHHGARHRHASHRPGMKGRHKQVRTATLTT